VSSRIALIAVLLVAMPVFGPSVTLAQPSSTTSATEPEMSPGARDRAARRAAAEEEERAEPRVIENSAIRYGLRIQGYAQFGFLGQIRLSPAVDDPGDIHFSYGAELRMTYPIAKYFVAGGAFGFRRFRTDGSERDDYGRSTFFQAGVILQPRIPITLKNRKLLEFALTIPVGLGITSPSQNWLQITGGAGLEFGGLGTIQYFIAPRLVWSLEAGWIHQITWHGVDTPGPSDDRTRMSAGQFVLRLGFGIRI
jgi:hypothetical protein